MAKGYINLFVNAQGLFAKRGKIVDCAGRVIPSGAVTIFPIKQDALKRKRIVLPKMRRKYPGMNAVTLEVDYKVKRKH